MTSNYLQAIADTSVYDVASVTPVSQAPGLSDRLTCDISLKREDLQPIFSFKCRGSYNKMSRLSDQQKAVGVVAASAGTGRKSCGV